MPRHRKDTLTEADEGSADERTGIAAKASTVMNYAATSTPQSRVPSQTTRATTNDSPPDEKIGLFGRLGAIELENKGSVARDHLALERTFLAWLRTSLAFASIGVAITQLFRLNSAITPDTPKGEDNKLRHMGKPLGATFLGIAIVVLFIGANRYFECQSWLLKGKFPASRGSVFVLALIASLLITASLIIVLVVGPSNYER